jgi:hypothetical protein
MTSPHLRAPGRAALALLLLASATIAVTVARAEPAAAACFGGSRTISGTVEGQDDRFVSAQVSIVLKDSQGREIGMDGCVRSGGYATTVLVNAKGGGCCFILPGSGATTSPYTDHTGTYALTRSWSLSGIPSNAAQVWIETYTKKAGGQPNTSTERFGHSIRRITSISSSPIHIVQPLRCGISGAGQVGNTGSLAGRVFDNGAQVTATRVSAFSTSPDGGNGGSILAFNVVGTHPAGQFRVDSLTPGKYSIFLSANGVTRRVDNLVVSACAETTVDVAVRGSVPPNPDMAVAGDWDGDGDDEPGVFTNGRWALRSDAGTTGTALPAFTYGTTGDLPVVGDWNGDGIDEPAVFRRGEWFLRNNTSTGGGTLRRIVYGTSGDLPVAGDWNGDGIDQPAIFRRGEWFLRNNSSTGGGTVARLTYGTAGDQPVAGNWDADAPDEPAVFRRGDWYFRNGTSAAGGTIAHFLYGISGDRPAAGNWDADAPDEPGILRQRTWYLRGGTSTQGTILSYRFPA